MEEITDQWLHVSDPIARRKLVSGLCKDFLRGKDMIDHLLDGEERTVIRRLRKDLVRAEHVGKIIFYRVPS
jgi:hypothetical protein